VRVSTAGDCLALLPAIMEGSGVGSCALVPLVVSGSRCSSKLHEFLDVLKLKLSIVFVSLLSLHLGSQISPKTLEFCDIRAPALACTDCGDGFALDCVIRQSVCILCLHFGEGRNSAQNVAFFPPAAHRREPAHAGFGEHSLRAK
jgi:hypothetical protein